MEVLAIEQRNQKLVYRQMIDLIITFSGLAYLTLCHYVPELINITS